MLDRFSREYRRDEEMYIDDQCCGNCGLEGGCGCPMYLDEFEEREKVIRKVEKKRKEDAVVRDGKPKWCIYWEPRSRRRAWYQGGNRCVNML